MSDEAEPEPKILMVEQREDHGPSRKTERRNTKVGVVLAFVGAAGVVTPVVFNREAGTLITLACLALVMAGCTLIVPETFKPLFAAAIEKIPMLKKPE